MTAPVAILETSAAPPWRAARASWVRLVREGQPLGPAPLRLRSPRDVQTLLAPRVAQELGEVFYLLALDAQSQVLGILELTRGTATCSLIHPREVYRAAIALGAVSIIVAHNHPSGDPTPSADDRTVTRQLADAGKLLDHPAAGPRRSRRRPVRVVCGGELALMAPTLRPCCAALVDRYREVRQGDERDQATLFLFSVRVPPGGLGRGA